jgi:hypothetical protein
LPSKNKNGKATRPFAEKMTDILNYGALNLAMGIGYQARLFDVMDELKSPQPVEAIAEAAGLNARYVREWLFRTYIGSDENHQRIEMLLQQLKKK